MSHSNMDFNPDRSDVLGTNKAKASEYIGNSTLFDGTGWVTEKNMHTDMYEKLKRIYILICLELNIDLFLSTLMKTSSSSSVSSPASIFCLSSLRASILIINRSHDFIWILISLVDSKRVYWSKVFFTEIKAWG